MKTGWDNKIFIIYQYFKVNPEPIPCHSNEIHTCALLSEFFSGFISVSWVFGEGFMPAKCSFLG